MFCLYQKDVGPRRQNGRRKIVITIHPSDENVIRMGDDF
jgi:hypothetical protein